MTEYERAVIKSKIVSFAYEKFPNLVQILKECKHSVGNSYQEQKKYHLEDSVWTHTLMVLNAFDSFQPDINGYLCGFCHDFGKPLARETHKQTARFLAHGPYGVQTTIDFITAFIQKFPEYKNSIDLERIIQVVSGHIGFLNLKDDQIFPFVSYDKKLFRMFNNLAKADNCGRIVRDDQIESYSKALNRIREVGLKRIPEDYVEPQEKEYEVILLCGLNTLNKKYYSQELNLPIISWDETKKSFAKELKTEREDLPIIEVNGKLYRVGVSKLDVKQIYYMMIENDIEEKKKIIIYDTFYHSRERKKIINVIRDMERFVKSSISIRCIYLFAESEKIINSAQRDNNTEEIPVSVIQNQIYYQNLPSMVEGFDSVQFIYN